MYSVLPLKSNKLCNLICKFAVETQKKKNQLIRQLFIHNSYEVKALNAFLQAAKRHAIAEFNGKRCY